MDQGLLKTRNVFIDKILELEDSSIAILLLIHFSRHQNLFLHNPKDWEDSPTGWLTEDKRIQDEIIGILSFVILYSLTNAHIDKTIFPEHRDLIMSMGLEDFLNQKEYFSSFDSFIGKKLSIKSISDFFGLPKENTRRYMKLILEAGFIGKDKKYGYMLNIEAYKQYIFTDSLNNICKSLMITLADFISNIEDEYQVKFDIKPLKNFNLKKANLKTWCRVRLHLYHFWVRVLTLDGNDKNLSPNDRAVLSASVYFKNRQGILQFKNISELYENNLLLPTNIASISEAAQMPRETVRRSVMKLIKLKHLEKKGRDIYRYNYPKKGGEIDNFLKVKQISVRDMMNFYFNIYNDLSKI